MVVWVLRYRILLIWEGSDVVDLAGMKGSRSLSHVGDGLMLMSSG